MSINDDDVFAATFETRAQWLINHVFGGSHHVGRINRTQFRNGWWFTVSNRLSTYDFDGLTKLVLAAHRYCLRVEIGNGGPYRVKIIVSERTCRDGATFADRHPTIQQAIAAFES